MNAPTAPEPDDPKGAVEADDADDADDGDERTGRRPPALSPELLEKFRLYVRTSDRRVRNELIEIHRPLAFHIANRFGGRGVELDDLRQVALLALLRSVERFDPERGVAFSSFAGRTIEGSLKQHFRDESWSLRVPRSAKQLHVELRAAADELTQRLGRSPTVPELARAADVSTDDVLEALTAGAAYRSASLDAPAGPDGGSSALERNLGTDDPGYQQVELGATLGTLVARLPERERTIIELRFVEGMSQSEIAERVGISQMHVSRLLRRTLVDLRARLGDDAAS